MCKIVLLFFFPYNRGEGDTLGVKPIYCSTLYAVLRIRIRDTVPFDPWIRDSAWVKYQD
jgi:hypothetical protein